MNRSGGIFGFTLEECRGRSFSPCLSGVLGHSRDIRVSSTVIQASSVQTLCVDLREADPRHRVGTASRRAVSGTRKVDIIDSKSLGEWSMTVCIHLFRMYRISFKQPVWSVGALQATFPPPALPDLCSRSISVVRPAPFF